MLRIESVRDPFTTPRLAAKAALLVSRAGAMGLLGNAADRDVILDRSLFKKMQSGFGAAGIGLQPLAALASRLAGSADPAVLETYLDQLAEALEASPAPSSEWKALVSILGVDLTARLLHSSAVSVRRYHQSQRPTPDDVAIRLHLLALVVGDLGGAYNEIGIRQWFDRKRTSLGDRSPAAVLESGWTPEQPGARRVRELAAALTGSPAT